MPATLPPLLAPYIHSCLSHTGQTLVTSVLDTSRNWLLIRLISAAIRGIDIEDQPTNFTKAVAEPNKRVVFLSLLHSKELWLELGKKSGVDFASFMATKRLGYIDGLTYESIHPPTSTPKAIALKSLSLQDVLASIRTARQGLLSDNATNESHVLILDGIDFLLASQPETSALGLSQFLMSMGEEFTQTFLTMSADSPLLHSTEASATLLEINNAVFLRTASYQSSFVIQLRSLDTGVARDVSGVVRVSHGGQPVPGNEDLPDNEWLYHVRGDGSVKVWSRGD